MINLKVEDYCQECPFFDPEVNKAVADNYVVFVDVYCTHSELCRRLHRHLKEELKKTADQ